MSDTNSTSKTNSVETQSLTTPVPNSTTGPTTPNASQPQPQETETEPEPHPEWIQSALSIIKAGKEAELQHRQTVNEMKTMAEMLDMQAPFPATIMAVSALVRDHPGDAVGKALVEGVLWGVIEELTE
ncbi:hypothetical protein P170DRAFT_430780 [Aspergillus steynii IBT 23096]|uniref:Uncharacterized protein n=1 Tax=Aspergillus steynii IBT 23096 TaxID=1392250 RepID=A0A2I2FT08_9EURO|nr:uncharacterized protein P170DRAFT_430780 [Aspergillus steynii IBT 23096]PLB43752.1 hypothetical protein P170DRAFT_430780 [Aspergillus steynii IBT 23096]